MIEAFFIGNMPISSKYQWTLLIWIVRTNYPVKQFKSLTGRPEASPIGGMVVEEEGRLWLLAWMQIMKPYFMNSCRVSSLNWWGHISETCILVLLLCVWLLSHYHSELCCRGLILHVSSPRTEWHQPHGKLKEIEKPLRTQRQAHSRGCFCVEKLITGSMHG